MIRQVGGNDMEKMLCRLGLQDIPVTQSQPEFMVDLLSTNILLFGGPMRGKSSFIKLLVTILHKQYNESEEQIFILDFGGSLSELEQLPLVSAYFDNSNEEYVKRVFKLLEDQLKDNNKVLKSKNYSTCEERPIHTTLFIDNVNAFLDEPRYTTYQEKLAKLCRDGLSKGVTVVLAASQTKGLGSYLGMSSFKQKIALEMPMDTYPDIFGHKVIPIENNPGRGYANVTEAKQDETGTFATNLPYEVQLYYPDDVNAESFKKRCEEKFAGGSVKKYTRFPDVLTESGYKELVSDAEVEENEWTIDVGLDYTECMPITVDYSTARAVGIYGKKGFGKTNLLRRLLSKLMVNPSYHFVFFDDGRAQLKEFDERVESSRKDYIFGYEKTTMSLKRNQGSVEMKLSPFQRLIKLIHENYMDLSDVKRMADSVLRGVFGSDVDCNAPEVTKVERKNTVFVLQSKLLYVNSADSKNFMEAILPLMVARAEEMNWIFIFSDIKAISESETRDNFHSTINTAFLLDNIAEFVGERGSKSVFGAMDVKSLKEEYARCEEGDGYIYAIEQDELKKLKFIKEE